MISHYFVDQEFGNSGDLSISNGIDEVPWWYSADRQAGLDSPKWLCSHVHHFDEMPGRLALATQDSYVEFRPPRASVLNGPVRNWKAP